MSNLVIAGEWTNFDVNVGYYEGAIISGLQAGQTLRSKQGLTSTTKTFVGVEMG